MSQPLSDVNPPRAGALEPDSNLLVASPIGGLPGRLTIARET